MAGQNSTPRQADSKLEFLILAGLLFGFAVFVSIAVGRNENPHEPEAATVKVDGKQPVPAVPMRERVAQKSEKQAAQAPLKQAKPRPNLAKRLEAFAAEKARNPLPAIAQVESADKDAKKDAVAVANLPVLEPPDVTEFSLRTDLLKAVPIFGLNQRQSESALDTVRAFQPAEDRPSRPADAVLALLPESAAEGLPFAKGAACRLDREQAHALEEHSAKLHEQLALTDQSIRRRYPTSAESRRDPAIVRMIKNGKWQGKDAIPALFQVLQVETEPVRGKLVAMAARHRSEEATDVLVNRAVFDLSPNIRRQAIDALESLPAEEYRDELLEALRYPWPPAAWNSAQALVALDDKKAVPELAKLLNAENPSKPHYDESGEMIIKQLVRIPHLQNCLLCHAPAKGGAGLVRGKVPDTRARLVREGGGRYYSKTRVVRPDDVFVRADVTYLRQDFSLTFGLDRPGPGGVRFDFVVWTRPATEEEIAAAGNVSTDSVENYPQRDAVLYALQKLTGANPGTESEDWLALTR